MRVDKIIGLAKQGNHDALHDLIESHLPIVERFAYQIGVSANDVEDVTQEVFIRVFRFIDQFSGKTFSTWLYTITLNVARDYFKKTKREQNKIIALFREPTSTVSSDKETFQNEEDAFLHKAIQDLDQKYKVPLVLYYFHDKKIQEISQILSIPESTVKTRLSRAKSRLKKMIEEKGGEFDAK
ncbi:RNA polymerase subunit sigma [Pueribacillus theae]|uniref:RNA polymerase sigma factor n=1 Tax=Pueribacillus theae TaxID=2171751 RepID=A0A2U1JSA9_9BACI|nr:RNA polymerase sigma factor [Pueribacillus theae]PWA08051.1 RNA polymerase subunit sigma [Pueribacillus theae]